MEAAVGELVDKEGGGVGQRCGEGHDGADENIDIVGIPLLIKHFFDVFKFLMNFEKLFFAGFLSVHFEKILGLLVSGPLFVGEVDFSKEIHIIELMNLLTGRVAFHPMIHAGEKSALIDVLEKEISKEMEFRKFEFNNFMAFLFQCI